MCAGVCVSVCAHVLAYACACVVISFPSFVEEFTRSSLVVMGCAADCKLGKGDKIPISQQYYD